MHATPWLLVAEDSDDDFALICRAFRPIGTEATMVRARDGVEACEVLEQADSVPFLALLDLRMPRMNGLELLTHLRNTEAWKEVPVVILSSSDEAVDIYGAYDRGATAYLVKPVDFETFVSVTTAALRFWLLVRRTS